MEDGQRYGLHGRISNLPAEQVSWGGSWNGDNYSLFAQGTVRQTTVFGENITLTRRISTDLGGQGLDIYDTVENHGFNRVPHMMLYHINVGFPAVNDNARLIAPTRSITCRDADAEAKKDHYAQMQPPETGYRETVYFHDLAPDSVHCVNAAVVDDTADSGLPGSPGFGVFCRYHADQLPRFIEWKMMDAGTYVVGMEPANCLVMGRPAERAANTLQHLEPGETRRYAIKIGAILGAAQIAEFEAACKFALLDK